MEGQLLLFVYSLANVQKSIIYHYVIFLQYIRLIRQ